MIYPKKFESKIGFSEIRTLLRGRCLSAMGADEVAKMTFSSDVAEVNRMLATVKEFRSIMDGDTDFPVQNITDMRAALLRLQIKGTYIDEQDLFALRNTVDTLSAISEFLLERDEAVHPAFGKSSEEGEPQAPYKYPLLARMANQVKVFPRFIIQVDSILNNYGKVKDDASPDLARIRQSLVGARRSVSISLRNVLNKAQESGYVDKDITPTYRDGRLVIPVKPEMKRKIRGIVHDESATGKTVFVEPTEVVEANNRIRTLEAEEQRAIILILQAMTEILRPQIPDMLEALNFLGKIDFIRAKAVLADKMDAVEPMLSPFPTIDWVMARHPLLETSLRKQGREIVPLDINLTNTNRLLLISGPNAGGKSVCLKTIALLQYMMQCGLSVPMRSNSKAGLFESIFIDIGDEQSIDDDLSTYSSHLLNMKNMMKAANDKTLILIDEFGTGTEPQIGGAIAESVLNQFCKKQAWGVITTHYQNLKHFADSHPGVVNGAMLYDRHQMQALFQLQIGQPGSSFAIEIARKIGLPEEVIQDASDIVGSDYIQSDKYLQDIVRDKRYWESKRQNIHQHEKNMQQTIARYEAEVKEVMEQRKEILQRAKEQAAELLRESNRRIENTIREIREAQAEKAEAKRIREELNTFKQEIEEVDSTANDEMIARKIKQIQERKERKEKRRKEKAAAVAKADANKTAAPSQSAAKPVLTVGSTVRIKGLTTVGKIEATDGKMATVIFGDMRTKMRLERLEPATVNEKKQDSGGSGVGSLQTFSPSYSTSTRETIDKRRSQFKQDLDVRGMRGDEAINAVTYFIDDAILVGVSRVRILHGTGTGILRQLIREYLAAIPNVTHFADEHVQFGGAGITVVDLE